DDGGGLDITQGDVPILTLIRGIESPLIEREGGGILGEIETRVLRRQNELGEGRLLRKEITESHAFVENPEDQVKSPIRRLTFLERNRELVVVVRIFPLHAEGIFPSAL